MEIKCYKVQKSKYMHCTGILIAIVEIYINFNLFVIKMDNVVEDRKIKSSE